MIVERGAQSELLAATEWYEDQRRGLGSEFLDAVDALLERIAAAPLAYPTDRFDSRARRALVPQFPFAVIFVVQDDDVRIVAFAHTKRLPNYWAKRL